MNSADLPDDHPRITGVNEQYEPGEGITATCTAWHSNPPANLSWFINGEPVRLLVFKIILCSHGTSSWSDERDGHQGLT